MQEEIKQLLLSKKMSTVKALLETCPDMGIAEASERTTKSLKKHYPEIHKYIGK